MQNSAKWTVRIIAAILVLSLIAGFAVMAFAEEDTTGYMQLTKDADGLAIEQDTLLDLNGHHVTNATVAQGVTLRLMDSANDEYDSEQCGSFSGTVNGTVEQVVKHDAKNYLVIEQDGVYSAHRFYAGIDRISLVPDAAALGYKAVFKADTVIKAMVESYGYRLWVNDYSAKTFTKNGAIEKDELTLRVKNILDASNETLSQLGATATIYGQATITFRVNGEAVVVDGAEHATTLRQAVEAVNATLGNDRTAYTSSQVEAVRAMCNAFASYMTDWEQEYIFTEDKFEAVENVSVTYGDALTLGQVFTAVEGVTIGENVTVTVNGAEIAVADNWADTVLALNAGEAVITITDNDRCWTATNTVEVAKADPSYELPTGLTATYGETLADVALPEGFTWVDSAASVGNAGTQTHSAIYNKGENYNTVEVTVTVEVAKADIAAPAVGTLNATYGQTLADVALPEGFTWVDSAASVGNAGTQTHSATYNAGANYNTVEVTVTVEVAKADIAAPAVGTLNATYGQTLADVALPEGFTWVDSAASVGNAGTQTHSATYNAGANYNTVEVTVTVEVAKADIAAPAVGTLNATYGQTLADVALPEGFAWKNASESVGVVGANSFTAIYTPADANYKTVEVEIEVTVTQAEPEVTVPTGLSAVYNQTLADVKLPEGFAWKNESESVGVVGTNSFTAIYTPTDANYKTVEVEIEVAVTQAEPVVIVPTELTATVGQTLADVTLPEGFVWKNESEAFDEAGTLKFIAVYTPEDANYKSVEVEVEVKVEPAKKYTVALYEGEPEFLYRVGNANAVALSSLFKTEDGSAIDPSVVTVEIKNVAGDAAGTHSNGSIQFSGTGVVKVTISAADTILCEVTLEVVNATNVTAYSALKNQNSVLLNNITMTSGGSFYLSGGHTLYGNGFTLDATQAAYAGAGYVSGNYVVCLANATLDNIVIKGAVYSAVGGTSSADYSRALVVSDGNNVIANCHLSNTCSPVRVMDGSVEIINTTLKGGSLSNLDIRNGNVILDNVTTINQVNGNDKTADGQMVLGLGITFYYEQVNPTTTLEIRNGLTQYNTATKQEATDYIREDTAKGLISMVFGSSYSDIQYTDDDGNVWVNAGILAMMDTVDDDNITDVPGYSSKTVSALGHSGFLYTKSPTAESVAAVPPEYVSAGQYEIAPSRNLDYTTKNYQEKTDGSNDYCYYDTNTKVVMLSMDEGDTFNWDTSILTAQKGSNTLPYTVTMNGTDYTGKSIAFNQAGEYAVTYTYVDDYNYQLDENGEAVAYSKSYTTTVTVQVAVVEAAAKNAVFTFGSSNTASKVVTIGNDTYVMPNVSATNSEFGSKTVSGTTVYMPIINCAASNGKTSQTSGTTWYMLFPVFKNVVTITDYADGGTGAAVTYDSKTTTLPEGLAAVDPATTFKYAASADAPTTPNANYNSTLCYTSPAMEGVNRDSYTIDAKYTYKDNAGKTYYYYVRYITPKITNSACVTGDTLIRLADGSKMRVDQLTGTEELLVWNHTTASYDVAPIAYIVNHDEQFGEHVVSVLHFADGTQLKIVGEHVFFDADQNKYVAVATDNAQQFVGHSFAVMGENGLTNAELVKVEEIVEETGLYEVVTYKNITCFTNGILSASAYLDPLLNIFDVDPESMGYVNMAEDIATYGLYTYADFEDLIDEKAFELYNAAYLKIAVGKGYITWNEILDLIDIYFNVGVQPLSE